MKLETTAKAIIEANITQIQIHTEVKDNYEVNKGTVELAKILNKLSGKKKPRDKEIIIIRVRGKSRAECIIELE